MMGTTTDTKLGLGSSGRRNVRDDKRSGDKESRTGVKNMKESTRQGKEERSRSVYDKDTDLVGKEDTGERG